MNVCLFSRIYYIFQSQVSIRFQSMIDIGVRLCYVVTKLFCSRQFRYIEKFFPDCNLKQIFFIINIIIIIVFINHKVYIDSRSM